MMLIGARPMQGKTRLALKILAAANKAGRVCAYFTLEYTPAEARAVLGAAGIDAASSSITIDTSEAICADYMIARLRAAPPGAIVVIDYLQALDHQREKPALAEQVSALKAFARDSGLIFVFLSQIDRHYDAAAKALPDVTDIRLPNKIDVSLFDKTCFLGGGEVLFASAAASR
jgi:replicative DNA helicase